jgi:hypothetical protein
MFELTTSVDALGLQSIADVAGLHRRRHRSYRKNVCLITGNNTLNGASILNILNGFGGL